MNQWQYLMSNEGDRVEKKLVEHIKEWYGQRAGDVRKWSKLDCKYGADVIWEYRDGELVNIQVKLTWNALVSIDEAKRQKYREYVDLIVVWDNIVDPAEREAMEEEMDLVIVNVQELDIMYQDEVEIKLKHKPADMYKAMWAVIHNS